MPAERRPKSKRKRTAIVPRVVFGLALSACAVPQLVGCDGEPTPPPARSAPSPAPPAAPVVVAPPAPPVIAPAPVVAVPAPEEVAPPVESPAPEEVAPPPSARRRRARPTPIPLEQAYGVAARPDDDYDRFQRFGVAARPPEEGIDFER